LNHYYQGKGISTKRKRKFNEKREGVFKPAEKKGGKGRGPSEAV